MSATSTVEKDAPLTTKGFKVGGKRAIVTGAGSDLALRPEAQDLVNAYSTKEDGKPRAVFLKTDVTQWKELERMFEVARREFAGDVDIVCPGAGIYDPYWTNFWHPPGSARSKDAVDSNHYSTLDINLTHPIRTTQLAISHFLSQSSRPSYSNPKRILLISSIAGQLSNLNTPLYVAAKHGISGFTRSLAALDPRLGIRVNCVAPGVIKTPLWTEDKDKIGFVDPEKDEWATSEEVAEAMIRLVEDEGLVGGSILEVGAGQTRLVQERNDPGPSGKGHTVSRLVDAYEEVYGWLGEEGWGKSRL